MTSPKKPTILVADDHPHLRLGLKYQLTQFNVADAIYEAENGEQALKLMKEQKIDIVFLDVKMPVMDGFDTAAVIIEKYQTTHVIMMSLFDEESLVVNLIRMGVDGYMLKNDPDIQKAIEYTLNGQFYITPSLLPVYEKSKQSTFTTKPIKLTPKEERLLPLLANGLNSREIADALKLTKNTVESYRKELLAKFEVNNCTELVNYAHRTGKL